MRRRRISTAEEKRPWPVWLPLVTFVRAYDIDSDVSAAYGATGWKITLSLIIPGFSGRGGAPDGRL